MRTSFPLVVMLLLALGTSINAYAQKQEEKITDGTEGEFFHSLDSNVTIKKKKNWNEFNLHFTTIRLGAGTMFSIWTCEIP